MYPNRRFQPFNGDNNYPVWKIRIQILLQEMKVVHVIDQEPPSEPDAEWIAAEKVAERVIVEHLTDNIIRKFVSEKRSVRESLLELDGLYSENIPKQIMIRSQIADLKYEPPLIQYLAKMNDLMDDLVAAGAVIPDYERIWYLLHKLPREYHMIRTVLKLLPEDRLNLVFVQDQLLQEEAEINSERQGNRARKLVQNNFKKRCLNKQKSKCFRCGKLGHYRSNCFLLKDEYKNIKSE